MEPINETAITIDHDDRRIRVDTTNRAVMSRLKKMGFKGLSEEDFGPYSSWEGVDGQVTFRQLPRKTGKAPSQAFVKGRERILAQKRAKKG